VNILLETVFRAMYVANPQKAELALKNLERRDQTTYRRPMMKRIKSLTSPPATASLSNT
jgi:hypothetical protein